MESRLVTAWPDPDDLSRASSGEQCQQSQCISIISTENKYRRGPLSIEGRSGSSQQVVTILPLRHHHLRPNNLYGLTVLHHMMCALGPLFGFQKRMDN